MDNLNIPTRSMQGKTVDLTAQAAKLTFEPKFRAMDIRAAKHLLRTWGVEATIPEPEALRDDSAPVDDGGRKSQDR